MLKKMVWPSVLVMLSYLFIPLISYAALYSTANLVGTWEANGLASGPGAPWWIRGPITFYQNGTWSAVLEQYPGETATTSGNFTISSDGAIVINWTDLGFDKTMACNMDLRKTFIACTQSWTTEASSTTSIALLTKKGSSYSMTDLVGTWGVNATASGTGVSWWESGTIAIAGNGSFSGTLYEYGYETDNVSGLFNFSSDGVITIPAFSDAHVRWTMDTGKTVAVGTSTWAGDTQPGTSEMMVITKKSSSYSQADVSGVWAYHSLVSGGPEAPKWFRGAGTVNSSGFATFSETDNTGGHDTYSKSLIITSNGSFSGIAPGGGVCNMDAGKTVIACTISQTTGETSVEIPILVKGSSFTDTLPGHWAGDYIDSLSRSSITSGYGGTNEFKPDYEVTRDQMAAFIIRAKIGEPPSNYCDSGCYFSDVATSGWACKYIQRLYELGITTGYGGTNQYRPELTVTREQMAAFIIRAVEGEPPSNYCDSGSPFGDVPSSSWSCKYIKRLYERGITTGYGGTSLYRPDLTVTRAQMAAFIGRAFLGME